MTNFRRLLAALVDGEVDFIVIGGMAAVAHGSSHVTVDLDVVYERSEFNIRRLADALAPLNPYLRGAPPELPFCLDAATISAGLNFPLRTTAGDLDLMGEASGSGSYPNLVGETVERVVFGYRCRFVNLPTLIRLKRAAGRPKDLERIAELEALREESSP